MGAPGSPNGVTAFDGAEGGLVPLMFVAVTVNVYAIPFVRPDTTIGLEVPVARHAARATRSPCTT